MQLKIARFVSACACGFAAAIGILFAGSSVQATTYYWTTSSGSGGNGAWDTTAANNWGTDTSGNTSGLISWTTTGTDTAEFYTGSGTVAVNNPSVGNIDFDAGTGYTLSGGTINLTTLAGDNINVAAATSATINSAMAGSGGLNFAGPGALTLNGNLSFAGSLVVNSGTLVLSGSNNYGGVYNVPGENGNHYAANPTIINGGVLSISSSANLPSTPTPWNDDPFLCISGGTLRYTGTGATGSYQALTLIGSTSIGGIPGTVDVANSGANFSFLNAVLGYGPLYKTGAGTLTIGGQGDNWSLWPYVLQGTVALAKTGGGHAVSAVGCVNPGATLQIGDSDTANGGGDSSQIYSSVNNMNGTFDLNGQSAGILGINGTGTVTNNATATTSTLTFGYVAGGWQPNSSNYVISATFPGVISDGQGTMSTLRDRRHLPGHQQQQRDSPV